MASSFMGLYVQREGLAIAQKALDITGNNISNIKTPGYSRQRVDVCSVANGVGTLGYNTAVSLAGRGVDVIGVAQIRDRLTDNMVRKYSGDFCNVGVKTSTLSDVEDVFDSIEADELNASFASIINKMKAALEGFSADNADRTEMANISLNATKSVVQCVVNYNSKLNDISEQVLEDTKKTVKRINSIFTEMGSLNKQIKDSYVSMNYFTSSTGNYEVMNDYGPLELKDEMNKLIDELAQYGNVYVREEADGTFTVDFADRRVVEDRYYAQMAMTKHNPAPTEMGFEIGKNLMEKDDWYALNVKYGTGGDADLLVREHNDDAKIGGTINITGYNTDGQYMLDKGSLRGYLDVYNGRGIYAESEINTDPANTESLSAKAKKSVDEANAALTELETLNKKSKPLDANDDAKAKELIRTLEDTIGAKATGNANGGYKITVKGTDGTDVTLLKADGTGKQELSIGDKTTTLSDGTELTEADLDPEDIGGARGAELINDALENLAEINKEIAKLTLKLDKTNVEKRDYVNDALTTLKNYNGSLQTTPTATTTLTAAEATEMARTVAELLGTSLEGDAASGFTIKKRDGTEVLKADGTYSGTVADTDIIPLSNSAKAALGVQRKEAYEKAERFVRTLANCGVISVNDANNSNGKTFEVYLTKKDGTKETLLSKSDPGKPVTLSVAKGASAKDSASVSTPISLGGSAGEYLDAENYALPNSYTGIEYYRDMLNSFVRTMTREMNGIYADPNFNGGKGWQLLTYENKETGTSDFRTAAENFRIHSDWENDPMIIANPKGDNKWEELDNYYINKMLGVFSRDQEYGYGTVDGDTIIKDPLKFSLEKFVGHICDDLGDKLAEEKGVYDATDVMLSSAEKARSEVMDVSMDEEGINMMNYQKWYNAIARMVTTLDEALDKLINGTGLVGLR